MYCGHFGLGLGAKGLRPRIPLSLLLIAALSCDWLEVACILLRLPHTAMLSHSIPAALILTAVIFVAVWALLRSWKDALFVGAVSLSHIGVDWITARKPSWPGGPYIGAHIYRYPLADFVVELVFVVAGWLIYRRSLAAFRRNDPVLIGLLACLIAGQIVFDLFFAG